MRTKFLPSEVSVIKKVIKDLYSRGIHSRAAIRDELNNLQINTATGNEFSAKSVNNFIQIHMKSLVRKRKPKEKAGRRADFAFSAETLAAIQADHFISPQQKSKIIAIYFGLKE